MNCNVGDADPTFALGKLALKKKECLAPSNRSSPASKIKSEVSYPKKIQDFLRFIK